MTNAGPLAGMWRCMSPHVFSIVMARSGRVLSALRPMAPSMPTHKDHEKDARASLPGVAICRALRAGFVFRRSSVSVSILTRTALQSAWGFRERARLARRNSVSTRLIAVSAPSRATSSSTPYPRARVRMRCSCAEGEGLKSLWRSILDIGWRVRLEGLRS